MSEVLYSYSWFKGFCESENIMSDSILVNSEIVLAKLVAVEIYKAEKQLYQLKIDYPEIDWDVKMAAWFKSKHEKRIEHMLTAIEYAEISKKQGELFNEWIRKQLARFNIEEPKI
ncbi:hypothetical protein ACEN30_00550 [Marinilactibacillus psychrotolerans]|uniref:hypothetical protein n=1 Tax=Marinilactibacillus psychrotolerans TaxID=191770 RepID=UPI00388B088C